MPFSFAQIAAETIHPRPNFRQDPLSYCQEITRSNACIWMDQGRVTMNVIENQKVINDDPSPR